jgi:hypothetical protein
MWPDESPSPLTQDHNRNLAAGKVLLIAEILVGGHMHFEAGGLGFVQQLAVFQFFPSSGAGLGDHVAINQKAGKRSRCPVVKENQHYGRGAGASAVCAANCRTA